MNKIDEVTFSFNFYFTKPIYVSNFSNEYHLSGAIITDAMKGTGSADNTEERALGQGCHDDYGRHYSVGQRWRVKGGSCACYRFGTIGCVGESVTAAPRTLPFFLDVCDDSDGLFTLPGTGTGTGTRTGTNFVQYISHYTGIRT